MFKLLTASVLMIIPGLVIPLVLAFSVSDKSCLYPFSVSINNQLLAIWTHQLLVAPCLVFLWCQVMFNRSQHISAVCFLSSAAVIIHTLHSSQRGPYVCVLHTCDHWRVVWAVSCTVQGRPVSWQQPPPVHPRKAGGMRGRERVNDDGLWLLIHLEIWRDKLLELLSRLRCRIAIQICCKTAENCWVDSEKTLKSLEG